MRRLVLPIVAFVAIVLSSASAANAQNIKFEQGLCAIQKMAAGDIRAAYGCADLKPPASTNRIDWD